MLNTNNNLAFLRKKILTEVTKLQLEGKLSPEKSCPELAEIPLRVLPEGTAPSLGSLEKDRATANARIIAALGFSLENFDPAKPLDEYVKEAFQREKPSWPVLTMFKGGCKGCSKPRYVTTDACMTCTARPCMVNCPKQAIQIKDKAEIDPAKCINCGLCAKNCPYGAIIKTKHPCEEACPVGAITKDSDGHEQIDFEKCIFCGKCFANCPFGAMMAKSQLFDVIKNIMEGKKVVAMYAPAIGAQFKGLKPGQLDGALLEAGFSKVWEVAAGADVTADNEAEEFAERMEKGDKIMTTSCCPAYFRAVQVHIPEIAKCVSETKSPMIYTAQLARKADPDCVTVFIGPCLAKKREGMDSDIIDYVLTVDEVSAFFEAKNIDPSKSPASPEKYLPTVSGRNFAKTGGVAESVRLRLKDKSILRPLVINGLTAEQVKILSNYGKISSGELPQPENCPNLIEVMCCEGGCIAGPGVVANPNLGNGLLALYANAGSKPAEDGLPVKADMDKIAKESL
ncbi:monomeric [FeFe] hydrogenase [Treponema berlinense]|uniref:monomeric [FeFe] hydrogenase n=1 Tax=Treponema berlinense TaxID=225004 RepID=UPI0026F34F57|nr:monomeric [FeFe] hydrogenase [Treponema berlinense]